MLQSCSGTSPADLASCANAVATERCVLGGIDAKRSVISWRRRAETVSMRCRPASVNPMRTWRRSLRSVRRRTSPFLTNRSHRRDAVGAVTATASAKRRHALRPPRGKHHQRSILGEGDLFASVSQRPGGDCHQDPAGAEHGIDDRVVRTRPMLTDLHALAKYCIDLWFSSTGLTEPIRPSLRLRV